MATLTLRPNGAGDVTQLAFAGAATNWQTQLTNDGETSYVTGGDGFDLYGIENHTTESTVIRSVAVHIVVKDYTAGISYTKIKTNGTVYSGSNVNPTTSFADYATTYTTNPQTGIAWTWAEVDALQAGVYCGVNDAISTQVYVVVDYVTNNLISSSVELGHSVSSSFRRPSSHISASVARGSVVTASRLTHVTRTASVALGRAITASFRRPSSHISASVSLGHAVTATRTVAYRRTGPVVRGLMVTASRAYKVVRTASVTLAREAVTLIEVNRTNYLCIASQSNGSIKNLNSAGTSWDTCAKDASGGINSAWLAQFDNRLCTLAYQNAGFGYSAVNDIVTAWTSKPNFPNLPQNFTGMFVGKDASNDPALYFLTPKGMYYLDVFTNFVFGPTELTWEEDNTSGKKGLYWKGDVYVAVGKGIYKVSGGVVTMVGPDMDDGLPEDMQGTVTDMIGVGFWLVIAVDGGNTKKSCILKRYITGKHWHPVYVGSVNSTIKSLLWDSGTLYFGEGTNVKSLSLPATTDNVNKLTTQTRCASGSITYPYFHSAFETMTKVAHKVWATTRDCNANEKITISYRIDENTAWTELGSFVTSPRPTALNFGTSAAGVEFQRIQLKATYARGTTPTTNSPKVESLILEYRVIPPTLWGWSMKIAAKTSRDRKGSDIIAALKTAIETGTLMAFYPDGDKSGTCYYVTVSGMPGAEKGTEFGVEGLYNLALQEVVG